MSLTEKIGFSGRLINKNDNILMDGIDERIVAFLRGGHDSPSIQSIHQDSRRQECIRHHQRTGAHLRSLDDDFTYSAYTNDITWNLALAYVKNDQIHKAISILHKLKADNPDTPIFNKADELIKRLQDL